MFLHSILIVSYKNINYRDVVTNRVDPYFSPRFFSLEKFMGKVLIKGLSVLSLCCCLFGKTFAEENEIIEFRTIGIPPYGIDIDDKLSGIYFDAANRLTSIAGYRVKNRIAPYARIIHELKAGLTDMTIMFKYQQLEDHVIYIAPLTPLKIVVMGLEGDSFDSVNSLEGKSIAYLRGAKFSNAIDNNKEITRVNTTSFTQGVKMLMLKRVDAIIGPMDPLIFKARELVQDKNIFGTPLIIDERTPWLQVSKKSVDKISVEKLQVIFQKMVRLGELTALRTKYMSMDQ